MEPLDEQSQRMLAPAPNFVWPERALERIDFFKPTAQPVISLVGFEMKEPRVQNSKPYAAYKIQVQLPVNSWTVERRFREFDRLSAWLNSVAPHAKLPGLPSKLTVPWQSAEAVAESRIPALDNFLQSIKANSDLFSLWQVRNFLGLDVNSDDIEAPKLSTLSGVVYVNVMEARNLPLRDVAANRPPTGFCEVQLASAVTMSGNGDPDSKDAIKLTEPFADSRGPRFFEEFVFSTTDRRVPLQIFVRDQQNLIQRPLLGLVQIDLRSLHEFQLYNIWLPVTGGESPGAEIHVMLQFSPMTITRPLASRLPSLRVHLHKFSFYPGETVRGVVVFNVNRTMPAQRVFLQIYGVQETKWNFKLANAGSAPIKQTVSLLNDCRALWHHTINQSNREEIYPGTYSWPFEFVLPPRMLPSACSPTGWNLYGLAMQIDRTIGTLTLDRKKHSHIPLVIRAPFTSVQPLPVTFGHLQKQSYRVVRDETVTLEGSMDSNVLIIGDTHHLHLKIENNCTAADVQAIRVKLIGFAVYKAVDRTTSTTFEPVDILQRDNLPIPPGETRKFDINVNVPLDAFPTLPSDLSPLITVHWYVRVTCTMKGVPNSSIGFGSPITSDIPVILSMPLPPTLDALVHPPMYPSTQPDIRAMIEYGTGIPHFPKNMISQFAPQDSLFKGPGQAQQLQSSTTATSAPPVVAPLSVLDAPLTLPHIESIGASENRRYTISPDAMGSFEVSDLRAPPPSRSFFFDNEPPANYPLGTDPVRLPPTEFAVFSADSAEAAARAPDDPATAAAALTHALHVSSI